MKKHPLRPGQGFQGPDHRSFDSDVRPAQIYAQAMAAARSQRVDGFAAILSRFAGERRKRG